MTNCITHGGPHPPLVVSKSTSSRKGYMATEQNQQVLRVLATHHMLEDSTSRIKQNQTAGVSSCFLHFPRRVPKCPNSCPKFDRAPWYPGFSNPKRVERSPHRALARTTSSSSEPVGSRNPRSHVSPVAFGVPSDHGHPELCDGTPSSVTAPRAR